MWDKIKMAKEATVVFGDLRSQLKSSNSRIEEERRLEAEKEEELKKERERAAAAAASASEKGPSQPTLSPRGPTPGDRGGALSEQQKEMDKERAAFASDGKKPSAALERLRSGGVAMPICNVCNTKMYPNDIVNVDGFQMHKKGTKEGCGQCHAMRNGVRCGNLATRVVGDANGNPMPLCSVHYNQKVKEGGGHVAPPRMKPPSCMTKPSSMASVNTKVIDLYADAPITKAPLAAIDANPAPAPEAPEPAPPPPPATTAADLKAALAKPSTAPLSKAPITKAAEATKAEAAPAQSPAAKPPLSPAATSIALD